MKGGKGGKEGGKMKAACVWEDASGATLSRGDDVSDVMGREGRKTELRRLRLGYNHSS
jgi:hypothetical protein